MPFEKGASGNPGGRPKKGNPAQMAARKYMEPAIQKLVEALSDDKTENRIKAAEALLNRGFGKPTEFHEITGEDGGPIENTFTVKFVKPAGDNAG